MVERWQKHPKTGIERRPLEVVVKRWEYRARQCNHCDERYTPQRWSQVYCSDACRNQAWVSENRPGKQGR